MHSPESGTSARACVLSGSVGASSGSSGSAASGAAASPSIRAAAPSTSSSLSEAATAWLPTPLGGSGGSAGTPPSELLKTPWRPPPGLPSALTGVPASGVPGLPSDSATLLGSPACRAAPHRHSVAMSRRHRMRCCGALSAAAPWGIARAACNSFTGLHALYVASSGPWLAEECLWQVVQLAKSSSASVVHPVSVRRRRSGLQVSTEHSFPPSNHQTISSLRC